MTEPPSRNFYFIVGLAVLLLLLTVFLARWEALQHSLWWYPETDVYWFWVLTLLILGTCSFLYGRHRALDAAWLVMIAFSLSGIWRLGQHILQTRSMGDLTQGILEGARRLQGGKRVYDQLGLFQSVNASPLAIIAVWPLATLSDYEAMTVFFVVQLLMLALFLVGILRWIRGTKQALSLADVGLALCALTTFFSFQRSLRLGQLDTTILGLLALSLTTMGGRKVSQIISASAAALATSLKIGPVVWAGPLVIRALVGPARAQARTWLLWFFLTVAVFSTLGAGLIGAEATGDFLRNLPQISRGSTSGNNYAVAARLATWNDRERRAAHHPLERNKRLMQRGIAGVTLFLLLVLTLRLRTCRLEYLLGLWLASLPLLMPICWDVYFVWCGLLPWLILWTRLAVWRQAGVSPRNTLLGVLCGGAYLIAGTMGNTASRDLPTGMVYQLALPPWLDDAPIWGHLLLMITLALAAKLDPDLESQPNLSREAVEVKPERQGHQKDASKRA